MFVIISLIGIVILFVVAIVLDLLSWIMFFYGLIFFLLYGGASIYLKIQKQNDDDLLFNQFKTKKSFDYCWNRMNEVLEKMTGGKSLTWNQGFNRRGESKHITDTKTGLQKEFRAFFGVLQDTSQTVVVIYDVEAEDIKRFHASPTIKLLENPFHEFDIYNENTKNQLMGMNMMNNRHGRTSVKRGLFGFNNQQETPQQNFPNPSDYADDVIEAGNRGGK